MNSALTQLLHNPLLWRGDQLSHVDHAVPSGFSDLDRELPGGGWPKGMLAELLLDEEGIGELRLLLPALQRLARAGEWIALVAPPHIPYAPAFAASSIDPGRVIIIDTAQIKDRWWAAEQVLRANSAGALLFWPESSHDFRISDQRLRRLQLAAQDGESLAFLFSGAARAVQPSPAPLRIRLSRAGADLQIDIFKRRGSVMARPLLLNVAAKLLSLATNGSRPAAVALRPLARLDRLPAHRSINFNREYPVDVPSAQIWDRATTRGDHVKHGSSPDSRARRRLLLQDRQFHPLQWDLQGEG